MVIKFTKSRKLPRHCFYRYNTGPSSLLDGSQGGSWWYAVGTQSLHGGAIPGPNRIIATQVELRVCDESPPTTLSSSTRNTPEAVTPEAAGPAATPEAAVLAPHQPTGPAATIIVADFVQSNRKCKAHKWFGSKDATLAACQARAQADPYCGAYFQWAKNSNCGCAPVAEACHVQTRRGSGADLYKAVVLAPGACVDVKVGSSRKSNTKAARLPQPGMTVSVRPKNAQQPWWRDNFEVVVAGDALTVKRTDTAGGWGQALVLEACAP